MKQLLDFIVAENDRALAVALGLVLGAMLCSPTMAREEQAVGPYKDFKGTIKLDVRDSKADRGAQ